MEDATAMDPRIWSKLPPDVVEHILLLLPLKTLLNLRPTCKAFTSLLFSPSFISKHASSSSPFSSFLLLSHPQCPHHFPLYDSKLCSWRNISLSLSHSLHLSCSFTLLSSSGGLFCLSDPTSSSFLVCNLFVKSFRQIQSPTHSLHMGHLSFVTTPVGYNIVLLCSESASNSAFVYDSNALSWRRFQGYSAILSDNCHQQGTFFDGGLYFTTPEPFSIVRFDLDSGEWERHFDGELPDQLTFVRLVSDGEGKLYLLGGVGNNGISRSIKLWEMGGEGEFWVEVQSLPEFWCRKFVSVCYHNYEHVYCFWHDGMICVCCYTWPEILYYSVVRRTWHWVLRCPYLPLKCSCGFKWFSFVPKLYASV